MNELIGQFSGAGEEAEQRRSPAFGADFGAP